jgi:hypothetical protein
MQQSENLNELAAALAAAQGKFEAIERNREVEVKKDGKSLYKFSYTTLDAIVDVVRGPLSENGLSYIQGVEGSQNGSVVETMLLHASGQWIRTITPVHVGGSSDRAQAFGSGVTYAKRYGLTAILGIVSDDDDDGNQADGNTIIKVEKPKSNRSVDDPNWTGPLGKSALKQKVSDIGSEIDNYQDADTLIGMLQDNAPIINQCARDLPEWWYHKKTGNPGGLKHVIHTAGRQLNVKVQPIIDAAETSAAPGKE